MGEAGLWRVLEMRVRAAPALVVDIRQQLVDKRRVGAQARDRVGEVLRRALAAHALAQSRALMVGRPLEEARQLGAERGFDKLASQQFELPGNHSHSLVMMDAITPECLGALIAAYEHKTYFLAVLLGINPFDQWGVELGKQKAKELVNPENYDEFSPAARLFLKQLGSGK